eukprot:PLAT3788.1.p2 GENE.PLAT3788.1~~PLAT3788.1.p2  ORF type:complete len:301 (-),score=88.03 PLAT3788.1:131-961(-)
MWGWFLLLFIFFHQNDSVSCRTRNTGAFVVFTLTVCSFLWVVVERYQFTLNAHCDVKFELRSWLSTSLALATVVWLAQFVLLMRFGTEEDVVCFTHAPSGTTRCHDSPDGPCKHHCSHCYIPGSDIPVCGRPSYLQLTDESSPYYLPEEERRLLKRGFNGYRHAEWDSEKKRYLCKQTNPAVRSIRGGTPYKLLVGYAILDSIVGFYGAALAVRAGRAGCAETTVTLYRLVTALSVVFVALWIVLVVTIALLAWRARFAPRAAAAAGGGGSEDKSE